MGNSSLCCKKATTVQQNSELALQVDTNYNNDDNLNNRTFRRSSFWSKKNNEINILKTEMGGEGMKYLEERDYFMKEFVKFMNMQYQRFNSNEDEESYDTFQLHNFMRTCSAEGGTFPVLILNIYNKEMQNEGTDPKKFKQTLKINPLGLFGNYLGLRRKFDGVTYFGLESKNKNEGEKKKEKEELLNDFYLSIEDTEYNNLLFNNNNEFDNNNNNDLVSPRLFRISFDINTMKYYIKDMYTGISTLTCVKSETVLRNNSVINIGESYILLNFGNENGGKQEDTDLINIKVYNKASQLICDPINFQASKSSIKIGRGKENEIVVNDTLVSRTHCTIQFDRVVGWTIRDGYFSKRVKREDRLLSPQSSSKTSQTEYVNSTNGTWLYAGENTPIVDGMVFKSSSYNFECVLEDN